MTFFGAAGVHTLLAAQEHATDLGRDFWYRGARGWTARVLDVADPYGLLVRGRA